MVSSEQLGAQPNIVAYCIMLALEMQCPFKFKVAFYLDLDMASTTIQGSGGTDNCSLFDVFYEELLTQLVESGELQEKIPAEFMQLQSDLQRVEYLMQLRPLVRDFRIKSKQNLKCLEKSTKFREEGNKLFQNDQTAQAIIVYNKSLSYAPHPTVEEYLHPEIENERHTSVTC